MGSKLLSNLWDGFNSVVLPSEWQRFNKAWLRHLISLIFKLLLEGKDLGCSSGFLWRLRDYKQSKQATVQFKASSKTPNPNPLWNEILGSNSAWN